MESTPRVLGTQGERTASKEGRRVLRKRASLHFQLCWEAVSIYTSLLALLSSNTSLPDGCGITCKAACRLFLRKESSQSE